MIANVTSGCGLPKPNTTASTITLWYTQSLTTDTMPIICCFHIKQFAISSAIASRAFPEIPFPVWSWTGNNACFVTAVFMWMICILNICFINCIRCTFTIAGGVIRIIAEWCINSYYNLGIQSVQPIYTEEQSITSSHRPSDPTYHGGSYTFPETYNGKKFLCILLTSVTYDPGVSTTTKITITNNGSSISFYTSHSNGTIKFKGIYI